MGNSAVRVGGVVERSGVVPRSKMNELARHAGQQSRAAVRRARERVENAVGAVKRRVTWLVDVKRIAESRPIRRRAKA